PLALTGTGGTYFYHADGLGSIMSLTNGSGQLANSYVYDSFGNLTASTGTITNPFRYTAREFDSETGLYYYRARFYDPVVGRFLSEDPNKNEVAVSMYVYVENSAITQADPNGASGLVVGPNTKAEWVAAFNGGFAEALNRLNNPDCRKLFCKKKTDTSDGLANLLKETE